MGPMWCWVRRLPEFGEDDDPGAEGVGAVEVELGVAEVEVAVGQEEGVSEVGVEAIEEGGVVGAAGQAPLKAAVNLVAVYWAAKKPEWGGRRKGRAPMSGPSAPMGMSGKLGLLLAKPVDCRRRWRRTGGRRRRGRCSLRAGRGG